MAGALYLEYPSTIGAGEVGNNWIAFPITAEDTYCVIVHLFLKCPTGRLDPTVQLHARLDDGAHRM